MADDAVTLREQVVPKSVFGTGHDMVVRFQHEAPFGPNGELVEDKHARQDLANAKWMMEVLQRHYAGVPWRTKFDGAQKMAYFNIPILMGINQWWAINLTTDPLDEGLLMRAGGEMLERYGMSRQRFNLTEFLDARAKHSALARPWLKVPE
jgi:hypothetical protein